MDESWNQAFKKKLLNPEAISSSVEVIRNKNKTIATLNGSFDLLHAGHLHIIYEASKQADILIVALNTDRSIQEYKSPQRPLISLEYRLQMMAALSFVDYVTWFDETDPIHLLAKIKPDVHVNGSEYGANCIEGSTVRQNGGHLHIVSLMPGLSTTEIVNKIKAIT
ncbi:Uncharacterized protein PHSC3_001693 [Chlamydiales bacterium STE3]|nr:Uncharacterized protein PHSC3_001693 [Chlamydiales bacterium STE3]